VIEVIPGSGENYIYYIGAFKKFAPKNYFIEEEKNHELNAHQLTFTCAASRQHFSKKNSYSCQHSISV